MLDRKKLNERATDMATGCVAYLKCFPCVLCVANSKNGCLYGVKYKGSCPVVKELKKRFNNLGD